MTHILVRKQSFGVVATLLLLGAFITEPAHAGSCSANSPPAFCGMGLVTVFADPSDGVIQTDTNGPCGSNLYDFQRTQQNFKEIMAVMLTAFSSSKNVWVNVSQCSGTRNIIDRGAVTP